MDLKSNRDAVISDFLLRLMADLEDGQERSAESYARRYPGYESEVRREYADFVERTSTGEGTAATHVVAHEGARVGSYVLERRLGRGGQGEVWRAARVDSGRVVALKLLRLGRGDPEDAFRRFAREAQLLARIAHPGIATVIESGVNDGVPFIAMHEVSGERLAVSPPRDRAGASAVARLLAEVADAVSAAHAAGVVHRDLKPENVLVRADGSPVVLDFGLARVTDEATSGTATGDVLGTPAYMAPEQVRGDVAAIGPETDVFSLCAIGYRLLCGHAPHEGPERAELYEAILHEAPEDPRIGRPWLSQDLARVLLTGLHKDPRARYPSAAPLRDDLRAVCAGRPVSTRPRSRLVMLRAWGRRHAVVATVLALAPVLILATAWFVHEQNQKLDRDRATAEQAARNARAAAKEARDLDEEYRRLHDLQRLTDLEERQRSLWPPEPRRVPELDAWLATATSLIDRLPSHRAALAALRDAGTPLPQADALSDELAFVAEARAACRDRADHPMTPGVLRDYLVKTAIPALDTRFDAMDAKTGSRVSYRFADHRVQWRYDRLVELVEGLSRLGAKAAGVGTRAEVAVRRAQSVALGRPLSREDRVSWEAAIEVAASELYGGFVLRPQRGLRPLGRDPHSRLLEFAHVLSGEVPERGDDGRLRITGASGIVLVLVPGGDRQLGAERRHPRAEPRPHADVRARSNERPVHRIKLAPYLIAKHEMTQGQWLRVRGDNPSHQAPGFGAGHLAVDLRHPVEQVAWSEAREVVRRIGLVLPTEAQWEAATRAGTTTRWWCGEELESLADAGNVADRFLQKNGGLPGWTYDSELDDGRSLPAPVDFGRPNPLGLHGTIGNVAEWCRDGYGTYRRAARDEDGFRMPTAGRWAEWRVVRGGSFRHRAVEARSARRVARRVEFNSHDLGLRPGRLFDE